MRPLTERRSSMGETISQRVVDALPFLDKVGDLVQPKVREALVFDGLDAATGSRAVKNAADASLAVGVVGALAAATTGLSDWRYLSGGSRRMGVAHGLLNTIALLLSVASLVLRA